MKQTTLILGVLTIVLLQGVGCATVTRGGKQKMKINTDPVAAKLVVDGTAYTTPVEVVIKRKKGTHDISVSKEGYQTIDFKLESHWDGGGVGAVAVDAAVPGGSALFLIDMIAGADRKFSEMATIKLPKLTEGMPAKLTLWEYKGKLMEKAARDAAIEQDKLFAKNKKKGATQPSGDSKDGGAVAEPGKSH